MLRCIKYLLSQHKSVVDSIMILGQRTLATRHASFYISRMTRGQTPLTLKSSDICFVTSPNFPTACSRNIQWEAAYKSRRHLRLLIVELHLLKYDLLSTWLLMVMSVIMKFVSPLDPLDPLR